MSKWIEKILANKPQNGTDKADKPLDGGHLSVLSVCDARLFKGGVSMCKT